MYYIYYTRYKPNTPTPKVVGRADQINSKLGQKCSSKRRCLAD